MERETGIEPATNSLEGCDSTIELLPLFFAVNYLRCTMVCAHVNPGRHSWFVCDSVRHRLNKSMSDLGGTDINIHEGTVQGVMRELCNMFVRHSVRPDVTHLMKTYREVRSKLIAIRRKTGARSLYEPRIFIELCYAAIDLAR